MPSSVEQLDPQWAWSPYEPTEDRPWNIARAAHLFRRAGFGASWQQLNDAAERTPDVIVRELVDAGEPPEFRQESEQLAQAMVNAGDVGSLAAAWLYRMLSTPHQLLEKMTLFWHGHFATSAAKVEDARLMLVQNQLLRNHALGRFDRLVQGISRDPAMLIYLDSATNRKAHPNENYAREVMELFCLGEGQYTEQDIRELARCFTGWQVKRKKFRFSRYQHDFGTKTIFGHTENLGGEEGVRLVLQQPAAPRFIARKLVRFLVFDEPELPDRLIEPLAQQLREVDFHVAPVIAKILGSQLFFSQHAIGRKIRSPVELACGLLRPLEATTNTYRLAEQLAEVGQTLFYPPNVKGWDGGRTWINSSTLLGRANLVHDLLRNEKTRFAEGSIDGLLHRYGVDEPAQLVDWLGDLLLAVPIPAEVRQQLIELAENKSPQRAEKIVTVIHTMSTLPEFQLG